jgi:hypothetical protein
MKTHAENVSHNGPISLLDPDGFEFDSVSTVTSASKIVITAFIRSIRLLNSSLFFLTVYTSDVEHKERKFGTEQT